MRKFLIENATIVNEGRSYLGSVLVNDRMIETVFDSDVPEDIKSNMRTIDANGLLLIPGAIDDQVHFREPGLTHKADIHTEARAAVAGGVTSYMEMPNTNPQTTTQRELEKKFNRASQCSLANFSFYMGTTNDNISDVLATDAKNVCGIKIFLGSSTGSMLVDRRETIETIFAQTKLLVAVHCEDEAIIKHNSDLARQKYGDAVPFSEHPNIRSAEACLKSSSFAVELAKKHDTRLHVLHISTAQECDLFGNKQSLADKRITAEACIHHLWFTDADYEKHGSHIKWNPAVKSATDRDAIWKALLDNRIDVIATDHAPHTIQEKSGNYWNAPSGGPLVQHSVLAMMDFVKQGKLSVEKMVEKMSHAPAQLFRIQKRGFIRPGFYADMVLIDPNKPHLVTRENLHYKCGWSPFEGHSFSSSIHSTFVNGHQAYLQGQFDESLQGLALTFSR